MTKEYTSLVWQPFDPKVAYALHKSDYPLNFACVANFSYTFTNYLWVLQNVLTMSDQLCNWVTERKKNCQSHILNILSGIGN